MLDIVKRAVQSNLGKKIDGKILIIESDDWGLVRMPSKAAFNRLQALDIPVDTCPFNTFDALESQEDIAQINEFCNTFKDTNGNPLKITANFIMANPDFNSIRHSGYIKYQFLDLKNTYFSHQGSLKTLDSVKEAYQVGTFIPQLHGREHLQVSHWLNALCAGDTETILAFEQGVFGHPSAYSKKSGIHFLSAYHVSTREEMEFTGKSVLEAASLFKNTFGFESKTFIAPRYIWPLELEPYFKQADIEAVQGTLVQLKPEIDKDSIKLKKRINWMGRSNPNGLNYLTRNVFFEPALNPNFPWEVNALRRIETAFFWGKPAVISMHRLNFVGGFSEKNRCFNLERLKDLIGLILKRWPDVQFMSSNQIVNL